MVFYHVTPRLWELKLLCDLGGSSLPAACLMFRAYRVLVNISIIPGSANVYSFAV